MKTILSLNNVHKHFGSIHAIRGLTLDVPSGQILGLLGPNGAGKTTSIRIITGVLPPSRGNASIEGLDTIDHSIQVRKKIGYLPESAPLYREMRVVDYLRYRAALYSLRGRVRTDAVNRAIDLCRLREARSRVIGELSKGYRQRVGLAAALLHDPPLLILDEPTSGLDPAQVAETRKLIRDLAGRRSMILVSHVLPEVEKTCDRIVILARGKIRADGTTHDLLAGASGSPRFLIEARAPDAQAFRGALVTVPDAQMVDIISEEPSGWRRALVSFSSGAADPRPLLAEVCARSNWPLRELRAETASLEELYIRLVERADGEEAAA
ncbi:MAG TPA: ABC transporter ATP-binding protein [Phycisphaerales bacterium]|nr:ABC transporter ATP-binding protein [Phycisphaerales bacterium]